jgi:hypothetical protein
VPHARAPPPARRGVAWFCHSRLMIAGVSSLLHYKGYELVLILSVTVLSLPHLLSFRLALLLPAENKKCPTSYLVFLSLPNPRQTRNSSSAARRRSPSRDSTRTEPRESRCLRNRCSPENLLGVCGQLGFWGATTWLLRRLLPGDLTFAGIGTANLFLHRLWFTTSSNALIRAPWLEVLVRVEPPMPSAWDPPLGIFTTYLLFL